MKVNKKNPKDFNALSTRFLLFVLAAASLLLALAPPFAAAQEQELEYRQQWIQWYFLPGNSVGECYANCVGACMPVCGATATAMQAVTSNCGGMCPSSCAAECPSFFTAAPIQADDGLQIPQTPEGWNPHEPYDASSSSTAPCYPGQRYCAGIVGETSSSASSIEGGGQSIEGTGITGGGATQDCGGVSYCGGAGVNAEQPVCPAFAPDGHPVRWDSIMGCYDVNWKEDYCGRGRSCNLNSPCTALQGCLWNGAACVPCNAPACVYSCPATPGALGGAGGGAQGGAGNANAQQQQAPAQTIVRQTQIPAPVSQPPIATPASGQATTRPTAQPTLIPTPPFQCGVYASCGSCVKAPKGTDGNAQCGWSEFVSACLDGGAWKTVNATGLKAGWIEEEKNCPKEEGKNRYCFEYADCFSCAGYAGVKRHCQWSVKEGACLPYNPLGKFRTGTAPQGNDVILPALCPSHDCAQYSDCFACQENAACLWNFNGNKCAGFKGQNEGETLYLMVGNCGTKTEAAGASPTPTPTPVACPKNCECNSQARVLKCGGTVVKDVGFVHANRASANAAAITGMDYVDGIVFNQPAGASGANGNANAVFVVNGHRSGTLLFLIPINVDYAATVNAQTGAVEKIDSPWWAFLAG